ncbi:MAG: energy transducer TonB [bacterium]|nr:energy transducer TonB [bacterium]
MNAAFGQPTIGLSANERFKLGYPRNLRGAAVAVFAILALIIRITPEYRPQPYVLRSSELTLIELEEPPVLTEPAPIAPPLPLPPVVEPGDDDSALDTIEVPPFGVDGRVLEVVVVKGAHPQLDRAAVAAARLCRFTPGKQREMPVKAWMAVPYRFRMN